MRTTTGVIDPTLAETVAELRARHLSGSTRSLAWRQNQLNGILRFLVEQETAIVEALAADLGRSAEEAWLGDIAPATTEAKFALRHLRSWMKPRRVGLGIPQRPGSARVHYEPLGVVLIIGPWNYPLTLTISPLIAAVAAGNCAVIKPSEIAPATARMLADLLPQYLDARAIRVVEGAADTTQELLSLGFDLALFTGGTDVGKKIMAAAAPSLTPVILELGGKSPVIVAADADLDIAARRIAWIKLSNSGQMCVAPDYVLADHSVASELSAKIVHYLSEFRSDQVETGQRIVNERQYRRLVSWIDQTQGEVLSGGGCDESGLRIEPTVILGPAADEPCMLDEIFGPILPVLPVDSMDDAVAFVNARPKPLALYVFTRSSSLSKRLVDQVPAGGVVINHVAMHCLTPQLPFGGVGASGMGAYHGRWGYEAFSHRKAVLEKPFKPDLKLVYPPYNESAMRWLRRLL